MRGAALAGPAIVAALLAGCGDDGAPTGATHAKPRQAAPAENVGTGVLASTRFAVPPIVWSESYRGEAAGYTVYARLTRPVPRRADGLIRADFEVAGVDRVASPIFPDVHRRYCYSQGIEFISSLGQIGPTKPGTRVRVTLRARPSGTLSQTVSLTRRPTSLKVSPTPRTDAKLGCGRPDPMPGPRGPMG